MWGKQKIKIESIEKSSRPLLADEIIKATGTTVMRSLTIKMRAGSLGES